MDQEPTPGRSIPTRRIPVWLKWVIIAVGALIGIWVFAYVGWLALLVAPFFVWRDWLGIRSSLANRRLLPSSISPGCAGILAPVVLLIAWITAILITAETQYALGITERPTPTVVVVTAPTATPEPEPTLPPPTATPEWMAPPYAVICTKDQTLTDAQLDVYLETLVGKEILDWEGWVYDVQASGGRYEVLIAMRAPGGLFWSRNVTTQVPCSVDCYLQARSILAVGKTGANTAWLAASSALKALD